MRARAVQSLLRLSCDFRELADSCYGPMRLPLDAIQAIARLKNGVHANAMVSMLCSLYDERGVARANKEGLRKVPGARVTTVRIRRECNTAFETYCYVHQTKKAAGYSGGPMGSSTYF
jgi:hypothetical protein